jgi:predicted PurR-regulated permease PerM
VNRQARDLAIGILAGGAGLLVLAGVLALLIEIRQLLAVFFVGFIFGIALLPVTDVLKSVHVPRIVSVLAVYTAIALALGLVSWYAAAEVLDDKIEFEIDEIKADYGEIQEGTPLPAADEVEKAIVRIGQDYAENSVVGGATVLFGWVLNLFTILFAALLYTVSRQRMVDLVLGLLGENHRERGAELVLRLEHRLRRYVVGELIAMTVVGACVYIGLTILGVPFAAVLAFIAFLSEAIPMVGPWAAYLPALGVALTQDARTVIEVTVLYLAVQGLENYLIVPLVHGRESQVPALLIIFAILAGGTLMGILGALVAVPLALILHTLFFELFVPWRTARLEANRTFREIGAG